MELASAPGAPSGLVFSSFWMDVFQFLDGFLHVFSLLLFQFVQQEFCLVLALEIEAFAWQTDGIQTYYFSLKKHTRSCLLPQKILHSRKKFKTELGTSSLLLGWAAMASVRLPLTSRPVAHLLGP